jgi:hypothetical protein
MLSVGLGSKWYWLSLHRNLHTINSGPKVGLFGNIKRIRICNGWFFGADVANITSFAGRAARAGQWNSYAPMT